MTGNEKATLAGVAIGGSRNTRSLARSAPRLKVLDGPSEAEVGNARALLCSALLDWQFAGTHFLGVGLEYFPEGALREAAEAVRALHARGTPVDLVTLGGELDQSGLLESVGGYTWLSELTQNNPTSANAPHYAAELKRVGWPRIAAALCERTSRYLLDPSTDSESVARDLVSELQSGLTDRSLLKLVNTSNWREEAAKPREDLFQGVMPKGVVCGVSAGAGVGKTMFSMGAAVAVATGQTIPPLIPQGRGKVLALFGEDSWNVIARRLRDYADIYDIPREELDDAFAHRLRIVEAPALALVCRTRDGNLDTSRAYAWLRTQIETFRPDLVVVDPLSQWFGGDENDAGQATFFVNRLKAVAAPSNATILVNHHFNKNGVTRGSTGFEGAFRWLAELRRMDDKESRLYGVPDHELRHYVRLKNVKFSDGQDGAEWWLQRCQGGVLKFTELKTTRMESIVNAMADYISNHDAHLTEREIEKAEEGAELRTYVANEVPGSKAADLREAIKFGIRSGVLKKHIVPTGKTRRAEILTEVPF